MFTTLPKSIPKLLLFLRKSNMKYSIRKAACFTIQEIPQDTLTNQIRDYSIYGDPVRLWCGTCARTELCADWNIWDLTCKTQYVSLTDGSWWKRNCTEPSSPTHSLLIVLKIPATDLYNAVSGIIVYMEDSPQKDFMATFLHLVYGFISDLTYGIGLY